MRQAMRGIGALGESAGGGADSDTKASGSSEAGAKPGAKADAKADSDAGAKPDAKESAGLDAEAVKRRAKQGRAARPMWALTEGKAAEAAEEMVRHPVQSAFFI